jgi:hypothetical protein
VVALALFAIVYPVTAVTARIAMKRRAIDAIALP